VLRLGHSLAAGEVHHHRRLRLRESGERRQGNEMKLGFQFNRPGWLLFPRSPRVAVRS
jgi:hypothetical protein